ncbi:MAG: hypothetical protein ACREBU_06780 [Nitrososphaera sp.]
MASNPDDNLYLEDWKMTKDRIKYFDDMVMKIRVGGLPIATGIQGAAFVVDPANIASKTIMILGNELTIFQLIILAGLIYLIPVAALDVLHFYLLLKSVGRALQIEKMKQFKDKLAITHKLSSNWLTLLHILGGYGIYGLIFYFGGYIAIYVQLPQS